MKKPIKMLTILFLLCGLSSLAISFAAKLFVAILKSACSCDCDTTDDRDIKKEVKFVDKIDISNSNIENNSSEKIVDINR